MDEEKNQDVLDGVLGEDGKLDTEKVRQALAQKQREVDSLYRESKKRGEKLKSKDQVLAEREQAIAEREAAIKMAEEEKLKRNEEYKELLSVKEAEIEKLKAIEKKAAELESYKQRIVEQQTARLEGKVNELSEANRELYETAAAGMAEDSYEQKLAFLEKLTAQKPAPPTTPPTGGREEGSAGDVYKDPQALYELKNKNPDLYRSILKERLTGK